MKRNFEKGITLVSLVVTIIVLIILAAVSINVIIGQDGIITKAKQAAQNMEIATLQEQERLNELYAQMSGESSGSISYDEIEALVEFKREIASAITDMGVATSEDADADTMASNIRSISGASSADKVSYDNTNSGLTATNVQGTVDELNSSLGNIGINESNITLCKAPSLASGAGKDLTFSYAVPDGWSILTIIPYASGSWAYKLQNCGMNARTGNVTIYCNIYNCSNSTITEVSNVMVKVILVKNLIK